MELHFSMDVDNLQGLDKGRVRQSEWYSDKRYTGEKRGDQHKK